MDDKIGREAPGTSLVTQKCNLCGADLEARQGRCPSCGSVIGEERIEPNVLLVLDEATRPGQVKLPPRRADLVIKETRPAPVVSVWRSGPNSIGPFGKLLLTAVVLAAGYAIYLLSLAAAGFYGTMGMALVMLMIGCFDVVALLLLWAAWRPTRVR